MTEQIILTIVPTCIRIAVTIIQTDQILITTHSANYNRTVTKSIMVHLSHHYDDQLWVTETIHCSTSMSQQLSIILGFA